MPMRINQDAAGDPLISIPAFSADEIRRLSGDADAEPSPCGDTVQSLRSQLQSVSHQAGMEIECLRQELAAERRCTAPYQARLAQVSSQKSAPGGWLWWPLLVLAGVGIVDMSRFVAGLMGWL